MKYWRGYLVAGVLALITGALVRFAQAHTALIDMIYPYMTRLIIGSLTDWSSAVPFCLWQVVVLLLIAGGVTSLVLMIVLRWNPIQWFGWVLATVSCIALCNTLLYGLNEYTGPIAEDVRLDMTDYTVSELCETTTYFRDKANELASQVSRDANGAPAFGSFEALAQQAGEGFRVLTYEEAISLFAGSTAPVKELGWSGFYTKKGIAGMTVALTGEAAVNPQVPAIALPFSMCREMARRMTIANEEGSKYAAYMACAVNPDTDFQYSAYCIAYYHCYNTLAAIPTSAAKANATRIDAGVSQLLHNDIADYEAFFGSYEAPQEDSLADMLTSWYVQEYITPLHAEEEDPFDPQDPSKVDLGYTAPEPIPLEEWESRNNKDD